jgi:predicted transcriptional regulator
MLPLHSDGKVSKVFDALATVEQATLLSRSQNRQCRLKKSVLANHIVCLDCGKHFSVLRRQMTDHKMTPEQYRQRWELPSSYQLVAPDYAKTRSLWRRKLGWVARVRHR